MAAEIHVDDVGTSFEATVKDEESEIVDVSSADEKVLKFQKPDKTVVEKTASLVTDGTDGKIKYVSEEDFLDLPGLWSVQGYVVLGGGQFHSDIHKFRVHRNLS